MKNRYPFRYMYPQSTTTLEVPPYLFLGLVLSLLVHAVLAALFLILPGSLPPDRLEPAIFVDIASLPKSLIPEKPAPQPDPRIPDQIVSPPEQTQQVAEQAPSRYLSDRDFSTPREQIRRGLDMEAGPAVSRAAGSPSEPRRQTTPNEKIEQPGKQSPKTIKQLKLDQSTLTDKFGTLPSPDINTRVKEAVQGSDNAGVGSSLSTTQPFSRPFGSGARFLGTKGVPDHLPHLPDGDITLLNTKANQFAVFVRRVALQVFSQLRASGWELLRPADIRSMSTDSTVTAVLSPEGNLLRVSIESSSGSSRFDEVLKVAVERGAKDPNPPPQAALSDGNIYFIFKARSWSQMIAHPKSGAPTERRWLILATGLE